MTEKLYDIDSQLKSFEARVLSCEKSGDIYAVVLDKTAFFPEGGGQEADYGLIDGVNVIDVQIDKDIISHYTEKPITEGKLVTCEIDWKRRFRNMQNHSGEHIVSGIVNSIYGYDNIGFHLGKAEVTLDFNGELNKSDILKIEKAANEAVYKNAAFKAVYPSKEELKTINYRSKKEIDGAVRIVTVEGYDICACCAPHVSSAAEIGIIKILDFCKNKGGIRLTMKCGSDALDDYNLKYDNILAISNALSVKQHEAAAAVEKLNSQLSEQKHICSELKKRLIEEKLKNTFSKGKYTVICEDNLDIKELQLFADGLFKKCGGICAVFSKVDAGLYSFAMCGEAKELDEKFRLFKSEFNVRGGGRNGIVQGTVNSDFMDIQQFLSNEV